MTKLLKILFVLLLVVTIAEAGYYVYMLKINQSSAKIPSLTVNPQNKIIPTTPTVIPTQTSQTSSKVTAFIDQYGEENLLNGIGMFSEWKKSSDQADHGFLIQSKRTNIYQGIISDINYSGGKKGNFIYSSYLHITKNADDFELYLNQSDLQKLQVNSSGNINANKKVYTFSDLKKGDKIRLEIYTNIFELMDKNTNQIIISKLDPDTQI